MKNKHYIALPLALAGIFLTLACIFLPGWYYEASAQELPFANPLRLSESALKQPYQYTPIAVPTSSSPSLKTEGRYDRLIEQSLYVGIIQGTSVALLTTLPENFTNFNKEKLKKDTPLKTWERHVSHPPVMDKDTFLVNASHAFLAGSGYHLLCRKLNYSLGECFVYSAVMSTIHEYFVEAFPEPPSIQDLIITPAGGFVIGELFYILNIPHPMLILVDAMESVFGPVIKKHNIRFEVSYGNSGPPLERSHRKEYREMAVIIKGNF